MIPQRPTTICRSLPPRRRGRDARRPEEMRDGPHGAGRAAPGRPSDPRPEPSSSTPSLSWKPRTARRSKTSSPPTTRSFARQASATAKATPQPRKPLAIAPRSISGYRSAQEAARSRPGSPSRSAAPSRASTSTSGARRAPRCRNQPHGRGDLHPPEGEARLRDMLANWEKFLHESRRDRSAHPHGGPALPVRGHPSVSGRQRPNRPHPQYPESDPGWLLDLPTLYLSRYILNTRGDYYRLLGRGDVPAANGSHGCSTCSRRRRDVEVDDAEDQGDPSADGRNRRATCAQRRRRSTA